MSLQKVRKTFAAKAKARLQRGKKHAEVWVHCNGLDAMMTMAAHPTAEAARHAAEVHAVGWTSPAAMIPGEFEWRHEGDRVERLYMPHPTEPEPRRTEHTVWRLTVNQNVRGRA